MAEEQVSLRQSGILGAIAFGVALAVIIGVRLEQAALAALVGVACGVGASIPTSLLIVAVLRRRDSQDQKRSQHAAQRAPQPPVVVVAPPATPQLPQPASWPGAYVPDTSAGRQFSIIGEEGIQDGMDYKR
jgi:hypothetical protein